MEKVHSQSTIHEEYNPPSPKSSAETHDTTQARSKRMAALCRDFATLVPVSSKPHLDRDRWEDASYEFHVGPKRNTCGRWRRFAGGLCCLVGEETLGHGLSV